ncbi:MAG TPA: amidase family protein, partial [Burkholderiales bacterium]|nr:amidase family protein [Burkholderiales bacterium]
RLAAVRSPVWEAAQPEQREIFASNVAALARAGALVEPVELPAPFAQAHAAQRAIMGYEGARSLAAVQREHRERLSARLNAFLDEGARVGEARYREALATRARLAETFARFMNRFDAVVTPPAKGEAPATLEETGDPVFCTLWTLLGAPALSIPVGLGPQGLPLGLQIVGAPGRDAAALAAAAWCEAQLPFAGLP